jgi:hypothetical protein
MYFDIFKYQRKLFLFFVGIPISFALFLISFMIGWILFKQYFPIGWMYLSFLIFITIGWFETKIISYFRFKPLGAMVVEKEKIVLNFYNNSKEYNLKELKQVRIFYAGDKFWKSFIGVLTWFKGKTRYCSNHWTRKKDELQGIDKIFLNDEEYHVKIRNQNEKNQLLIFFELLKNNKIDVVWQGEV